MKRFKKVNELMSIVLLQNYLKVVIKTITTYTAVYK